MINSFIYFAQEGKTPGTLSGKKSKLITRVSMPHVFKYNEVVLVDGERKKVTSSLYDCNEDCFIVLVH